MAPRPSTSADHVARIRQVQAYLEAHLDEPVAPAELAARAAYSLHHFHRVFRGVTGESVVEHQRRLRLERAARRLRAGDLGILEAALDAGYESHEAFTRAFAARFGVPPSELRATPGKRLVAWAASPVPAPPVEVRTLPPVRVAALRHVGGWATVGALFETLVGWALARGLPLVLYGRCPDDPDVTREHQLRFDGCVAVGPEVEADGPVVIDEIAGGRYAIAVHRGSYRTLSATYLALIGGWLPTTGFELAAEPVIEHYLDDPSVTAEDDRRTEVRVRLVDDR